MTMTNEQRNNTMPESRRRLTTAIELRRLSGPLLTSMIIISAAFIAVQEFGISAGWASISAAAGIALAGLWLV